jgi:hypothetical protein
MSLPLQRKCLFCDGVYASLDPKKGDGMSTVIYRDTERGQTNLMSVKIVSCNLTTCKKESVVAFRTGFFINGL